MSYAWRIHRFSENATHRSITSIVGQVITISAAHAGTVQRGWLIQLQGSVASDGVYTITVVAGGNTQFTVAEPITAQPGAGGNADALANDVARIADPGTAITTFVSTKLLYVAGAQFSTNGCHTGDRLAIWGSTSNDGSYLIDAVIDEDYVSVVDAWTTAANPLTVEAAVGNVTVYKGRGTVTITNEALTGWLYFLFASSLGWLIGYRYTSPTKFLVEPRTIVHIEIVNTGATSTEWRSGNEVVCPLRDNTEGGIGFSIKMSFLGGLQGVVRFGSPKGLDEYAFQDASYWFGDSLSFNTDADTHRCEFYGGAYQGRGGGGVFRPGGDSFIRNFIIEGPGLFVPGDIGGAPNTRFVNVTIQTEDEGLTVTAPGFDSEDLVIADRGGGFTFMSGVGDVDIADSLFSDETIPGYWFIAGNSQVHVLNPRRAYAHSDLFDITFAVGITEGIIEYTWDPRFVSRVVAVGIPQSADPIQGLIVRLYSNNGGGWVEYVAGGSPFTTQADGKLISAQRLFVTASVATAVSNYEWRMTVTGAGYRYVDQVFTPSAPFLGDITIDFLRPDFEEDGLST